MVGKHLRFTDDKTEWTGTDIAFHISTRDGITEVRFTHIGLVPDVECFDKLLQRRSFSINTSLRNLLVTGDGQLDKQEHDNKGVRS